MSSLTDQLTSRQANVFEFIKDRVQSRGYGPTVREIGEHFHISSPNGVMCHLRALEKKGLLKRVRKHDRAIARAIEIASEITAEDKGMPMAGTVSRPKVNGIISASAVEKVSPGMAENTRPTMAPVAVAAMASGVSAARGPMNRAAAACPGARRRSPSSRR